MKKFLRTLTVLVSLACLILSFSITGCTRHPNEKQCQAYEEQLQAATAAEEQLQEKKQALADAETKLAAQKQALEDAKGETEKVKQRLSDL
jgi:septal ring factor EnvC (AmiA/AmiB activator)